MGAAEFENDSITSGYGFHDSSCVFQFRSGEPSLTQTEANPAKSVRLIQSDPISPAVDPSPRIAFVDPVVAALAKAIGKASEAGQWDLVARLVAQLEGRQTH